MSIKYYISNGDIEYLNPGIKRPHQNAYQNETLPGNLLKAGRAGKRTRANVRLPIVSRILDQDGNKCRLNVEYIDPTQKGFKVVRLKFAFGALIVSD